jgi:hypothetical protein
MKRKKQRKKTQVVHNEMLKKQKAKAKQKTSCERIGCHSDFVQMKC